MSMIRVVDSHTGGEPTRVVIDSELHLGDAPLSEELRSSAVGLEQLRRSVILEPRGSDVLVGALLCGSSHPECEFGVVFFNNVGLLGMCGHGMIGVTETLKYLERVPRERFKVETPVGLVSVQIHDDETVSVENVPSYRAKNDVSITVPSIGEVRGDVAWGGNWFFLVNEPRFDFGSHGVSGLQAIAQHIRRAINDAGYPEVDHIELFASETPRDADSQNFVLCPGAEYDRSPCGTGTSAKLACLAADGVLEPNEVWTQAGVLGTHFRARYQWHDAANGSIQPTINGRGFVTAEANLVFDPNDPFREGIFHGA
ncbi:MAG: proline racemase family protein [Planctomycetota bacterium]